MATLDDIQKILAQMLDQGKKRQKEEKDKPRREKEAVFDVKGPISKFASSLDRLANSLEKVGLGTKGSSSIGGNGGGGASRSIPGLSIGGQTPKQIAEKLAQNRAAYKGNPLGAPAYTTGEIPGQPESVADSGSGSGFAGVIGSAAKGLAGFAEGPVAAASEALAPLAEVASSLLEVLGPIAIVGGLVIAAFTLLIGIIYKIVEGLIKLGVYLIELPGRMKDWANSLLKSQEYLKEFSGSIAAVFNQKEIFETLQNIRVGEATGGSAGNLESAYENISEALEPINIILTNIWNNGVSVLVNSIATIVRLLELLTPILEVLQAIQYIMDAIAKFLRLILNRPDPGDSGLVNGFLNDIVSHRGDIIRATAR